MIEKAGESYRRLLVGWVRLVARRAVAVVVASLLLSGLVFYYVVENMAINTDTTDMLSPDLAFRKDDAALSRAFPQLSDDIVVVIDAATGDQADDAARALAKILRQKPKLFGGVYDLEGEPFFRKNGLLFMSVDELSNLSDRLAEAQPFLGTLWRDQSLRGLFKMLGLAIDEKLKNGNRSTIEITPILNAIAGVVEAQAAGRSAELSWRRLILGAADGGGPYRRFLQVKPVLDFSSLSPADEAMNGIRSIAAKIDLDAAHGVRVRLTGSAALAAEELQSVEQGMGLAAVVSFVLVIGVLVVGLGSLRLSLSLLVTLIMGLLWTAGFALLALGQLNLISVAFAVLFIGLSVDFGIHFGLRYKEDIDRGTAHDEALGRAADGVGGALSLCAVTAAIAFYSFIATDYLGLAELGLIAGSGMFIALFANMTVLPALLTLFPLSPRPSPVTGDGVSLAVWGQKSIRTHARIIIGISVLMGLGAAALIPQARFDFDPMNLRNRSTESVSTFYDLMSDSRTSPYMITILAENLDSARKMAAKIASLDVVDEVRTLADYVPSQQDEKLDIIDDMASFLSPSLALDRLPPPGIDEGRASIDKIEAKLKKLAAEGGGNPASKAASRLAKAISSLGGLRDSTIDELEKRLLGGLSSRLDDLAMSLNAGPVTINDLPDSLKARNLAADGRVRVEVSAKENLQDRDALERFVKAVRAISPHASGAPVIIFEAGKTVVRAFAEAAGLAFFLIAALLAVLMRSARDVLLVFAPLVLAALFTVAASVIFGIAFNFANIIVLPLLFGLGVASAIHLVQRQRNEKGEGGAFNTSTPRAVVLSALTTIGSFGSIALSSHPGTASMGILLSISIALTLVCTLVVLPALMALQGGLSAGDKR